MEKIARLFEEASRETYKRWKNDETQKKNAEKNIELGIINVIELNNYSGFTRNNYARDKVMQIGETGVIYSLLYNMIQLGDYKSQKIGGTLGKPDPFITYVVETIKHGLITDLENMFKAGIKNISEPNKITMSGYDKVAIEFAEATLLAYSWYNTAYHTVSVLNPLITPYYQEIAHKLNEYYKERIEIKNSRKNN